MGADNSKVTSNADGMYNNLPPAQLSAMKKAEGERGRRLSIKAKTKTDFLGDVTAYPEKSYTVSELVSIEKFLSKRLDHINNQIEQLSANSHGGFTKVYQGITDGNNQSAIAAQMPEHKHLNRYNNIVAYDVSRVKVSKNSHTHNTDYINANYVHGHGKANMYIASQGPVPESIPAFWQMVWENGVQMIVMVTNEVEGNKLKAHRYWPDSEGEALQFGDFQIEMTELQAHPTYIGRCFKVTNATTNQNRFVFHYQYVAWPDHGVPQTSVEMLKFRAVVKEKYQPKEGPMIVHCSAGVGRTGTFIGLDRFLDSCADLDDSMTILDIVKDMRKSRNYMVQAQAQFVYLYYASAEGLVKLHQKVERELRMTGYSPVEKEQALLAEIETDMQEEAAYFAQHLSQDPAMSKATKSRIVPHARSSDGSNYKDDLHAASTRRPEQRIQSLAHSTTAWVNRANVPLSPEEHGYSVSGPALESRLAALSDSRTKWMKVYTEAEKTWQSAQDEEGVYYDVGHQLTSIESRVMSLANADAAWALSGTGGTNVYEEMQSENLANLELRLQSLSYTLMTADQRWKDRGSGFRGPTDKDYMKQLGESNTSFQGNLNDRLVSLQKEHTAWKDRSGWSPFDKEKFFEDVGSEYERQEKLKQEREAKQKELEEKMAKVTMDKDSLAAQKIEQDAAAEADSKRRSKAKEVAKRSSQANVGEYLPHQKQMEKKNAKQAKEQEKAAKEKAKIDAEEKKKKQKEDKELEKKKAKQAASKFMKKMTK